MGGAEPTIRAPTPLGDDDVESAATIAMPVSEPGLRFASNVSAAGALAPLGPAIAASTVAMGDDEVPPLGDAPANPFFATAYVLSVWSMRARRRAAIRRVDAEIADAERLVSTAMADLGRRAKERAVVPPQGAQEAMTIDQALRATADVDKAMRDIEAQRARHERDYVATEAQYRPQIAELERVESELSVRAEALRQAIEQMDTHASARAKDCRNAERAVAAAELRRVKEQDAAKAAAHQRERDASRARAAELADEQSSADRERADKAADLAPLEVRLAESRRELEQIRTTVAAAASKRDGAIREIDGAIETKRREKTVEQDRLVDLHRALGLRVFEARPTRPEIQEALAAAERATATQSECAHRRENHRTQMEAYDRTAYRRGLYVLGGGAVFTAIVVLLLAVL